MPYFQFFVFFLFFFLKKSHIHEFFVTLLIFFFLAMPMAGESSQARDQTRATAVTGATALTVLGP